MQKPEAKLENWSLVASPYNGYTAPEAMAMRLAGDVYGHDDLNNSLPDGMFVITSQLVTHDLKQGVAETLNTLYRLGAPDPKWIAFLKAHNTDLEHYGLETSN